MSKNTTSCVWGCEMFADNDSKCESCRSDSSTVMRERARQYRLARAAILNLLNVGNPPDVTDVQVVGALGTYALEIEQCARMWEHRADDYDNAQNEKET